MTKHQSDISLASSDYLAVLKDFALSRGIQVSDLLAGSNLDPAEFIHPPDLISNFLVNNVGSALYQKLDNPLCEAVHYGLLVMPSSHGSLGMAIHSSACLKDGLQILERYYQTRLASQTPKIEFDEKHVRLTLNSQVELLEHSKDVQRFFDISTLVSMANNIRLALSTNAKDEFVEIDIDAPAPTEFPFEALPFCRFSFDTKKRELRVPKSWLELPFDSANEDLKQEAVRQCETELKRIKPDDLIERIENTLRHHTGALPSIEALAERYFMSVPTLKRKLNQLNTNYIEIKNKTRLERAQASLIQTNHSIERIAEELGFSDASNFTKFFKKQTALTPKQYRSSLSDTN